VRIVQRLADQLVAFTTPPHSMYVPSEHSVGDRLDSRPRARQAYAAQSSLTSRAAKLSCDCPAISSQLSLVSSLSFRDIVSISTESLSGAVVSHAIISLSRPHTRAFLYFNNPTEEDIACIATPAAAQ
jgi:hypothetical protein